MPRCRGSPHLDGVYLEPALAQVWPSAKQVTPFVVNGRFKTDRPGGELTGVLWLTLQRYGIPVRGPAVADLGIRVDQPGGPTSNKIYAALGFRPVVDLANPVIVR